MKAGFYPRLALDGMRKNKRLYLPYFLTCAGMVTMYYIIVFLQTCEALSSLAGGSSLREILGFGSWVIALFALLFLFYTNAFLMRRRKKEFGLYNILGMGKWNLSRILFWENTLLMLGSLAAGLALGILLSKLAELGLVDLLRGDVRYSLQISPSAIAMTATVFAGIFLLLLLNSLRQLRKANAIALLHSESVGEKPPRANWFFGLLGALILGTAYYIAVSIRDPLSAMLWFFVAVVLVILATYLLFVAGSVLLCRILQRRKRYYYRPNHFISVSSMAYRMKRNGAGLASICILLTMVLVMISSTSTLYFGAEDALQTRYPREINLKAHASSLEELDDEALEHMRQKVAKDGASYGLAPQNVVDYRTVSFAGMLTDGVLETDPQTVDSFRLDTYANVYQVYLIPLADYNRTMGTNETLAEDEILVYTYRAKFTGNTLRVQHGAEWRVKEHLDTMFDNGESAMQIVPSMYVVVPDLETGTKGLLDLADFNGDRIATFKWYYEFDTGLTPEQQLSLDGRLREMLRDWELSGANSFSILDCESRAGNRDDFYSTFGGLFFLGLILSIVFLFAAVLMIYYKQISEGYEDQARFGILQKVGMTRREIRKSINSQLLTVFFLPLLGAGMHLAFAFPIIRKLLLCFNLNNVALFAATTGICFLIFAFFYTLVYRITSNAYYNIVSDAKR